MTEEIEHNYFDIMFRREYERILKENMQKKIVELDDECEKELSLIFPYASSTQDEKLEAFNNSLYYVCENYISLSNSKMEVFPSDSFEFVFNILDEIRENPLRDTLYKYSFLSSLQFIYQNYLSCLDVGTPVLWSSDSDLQESYMEITFDSQNKIAKFDCVNMSLLEQTKTMTDFVVMQKNRQIGPLPKVKYYYRKDI